MADQAFDTVKQDLRKAESKASQAHGGQPPKDSDVSKMSRTLQSIVDQSTDKSKEIEERKANLPKPEPPPITPPRDERAVGVGSGAHEGPLSGQNDTSNTQYGPATAGSSVRESGSELHKDTQPMADVGRQAKENLEGLPKDALRR
ncbi:hypothetical protein PHISCL_07836 [Aspergillus sclerotialis]|uniref:Uncharacterized protein n=1 Tax=Aspergillus sclerotialis TaxID=2070753 RepID=A0A3A2ZKD2_9EURO|nr:hypothetical protein PHISCL_07836 [Aspergillus sclerotialis]